MKRTLIFLFLIAASVVAKAQFTVYKSPEQSNSYSNPSTIGPFSVYQPAIPDFSHSTPIVPRNYGPYSTYTPAETVVTGTTFNATVFYKSSTGHENTYKLPVVVNKGAVQKIIFNDNGGCVHVGVNHSGYKYYGGDLEYIKDYNVYATEVTIVYSSNNWQKYTVVIE